VAWWNGIKCSSPLLVVIKDEYQQTVGGNDNLMPLDLSLDEAQTTTKPTDTFCLRKVSYQRCDRLPYCVYSFYRHLTNVSYSKRCTKYLFLLLIFGCVLQTHSHTNNTVLFSTLLVREQIFKVNWQ